MEIQAAGKDETGQLLTAMGNMTKKLRMIVTDVKDASDRMSGVSRELNEGAGQMLKGAMDQAQRASTVASAAGEMSQTMFEVAKHVGDIETSATNTTNTARDGERIVNQSIREVKEIAGTVDEANRVVESLEERSRQISEIVNVINDIADQTNLLALNAAIEAARAGEQGRGFAVVADEVRKLAERTTSSTSEIASMIGLVQSELNQVVASMGNVTRKVEAGVDYSTQAGVALKGIVDSADTLHSMVQQIATAAGQITTTSEEITRDIESIAAVSSQTSASSEQATEATTHLSKVSVHLQEIVAGFVL